MPMTLKQAVEFLQRTPYPYKLPTLRKAVQSKALKTILAKAGEIQFHTVEEADLMAWAEKQSQLKPGNPDIRNIRRKGQKVSNSK